MNLPQDNKVFQRPIRSALLPPWYFATAVVYYYDRSIFSVAESLGFCALCHVLGHSGVSWAAGSAQPTTLLRQDKTLLTFPYSFLRMSGVFLISPAMAVFSAHLPYKNTASAEKIEENPEILTN